MRRALKTVSVHCRLGGAALFAPDHVRETYRDGIDDGGHDGDGRALRHFEWTWDPDPSDTTSIVDYAYLLRDRRGRTRVVHDRHVEGEFPRALWLRVLAEVGFTAKVVRFDHSELEPGSFELFVGVRSR